MLSNFIKIAFRNFLNHKFFTAINLIGLIAGITSTLLILLYVSHETNYDSFHEDSDQLFRVSGELNYGGNKINITGLSAAFGPVLKENDSRVMDYVRLYDPGQVTLKSKASSPFFEEHILFTDPTFLDHFNFPLQSGMATELGQSRKAFITSALAQKYFGTTDVIGNVLNYDNKLDLIVAGVLEDLPSNTVFDFEVLVAFNTLNELPEMVNMMSNEKLQLGSTITFIKTTAKNDQQAVEKTIAKLNTDEQTTYNLVPLTSLHLADPSKDKSASQNIYIFLVIGILILLLALVNYINLTTARATLRAKEVGLRKVVGASKTALSLQFFFESSILIILGFAISVGLVYLLTPSLVVFLGKDLSFNNLLNPTFISSATAVLVTSILIAGTYPALVLTRFQPVKILKGNLSGKGSGAWIQKSFASFQFAISIGLILCTLVVAKQLDFVKQFNLGFDKDQVVVVTLPPSEGTGFSAFKNNLESLSGVKSVSSASLNMFKGGYSTYFTQVSGTDEDIALNFMSIDDDFIKTLDLNWTKAPNQPLRDGSLYVNKAALEKLNAGEDPFSTDVAIGNSSGKVQGVLENFNYTSLKNDIQPLVMRVTPDSSSSILKSGAYLYVKLEAGTQLGSKIEAIESVVQKFQPNTPFEYYFLDDAFNNLYQSESRLSTLFQAFSILAIIIACLGLLGLITFSMERRYKEIGIRKVLGAESLQVVKMVFAEYIWLFIISTLLAVPTAWWIMEQWLTGFNYRIEMTVALAAISATVVFVLGFATISYKSWLAATKDPVESLRYE